jgi:hypothetical protein
MRQNILLQTDLKVGQSFFPKKSFIKIFDLCFFAAKLLRRKPKAGHSSVKLGFAFPSKFGRSASPFSGFRPRSEFARS